MCIRDRYPERSKGDIRPFITPSNVQRSSSIIFHWWKMTLEDDPKWFPIPKNLGLDTKIKSLAISKPKLWPLYCMKWSLTSFSLFLTFGSIWGFWKWSQMVPHTPKPWSRHQNQVSSYLQTKVMATLLYKVVLDLLQPFLDLQVNLRVLKMVPNDSPCPKTWV